MSSIKDFYLTLSQIELLIVSGILFIIVFLFILTISLMKKNKKLRRIIKNNQEMMAKTNIDNKPKIREEKNIYKENKLGKIGNNTSPIGLTDNYLENVKKKLETEIQAMNCELTEYELKEEEEAIISFKQLNKDRLYNITDDEEDKDFLDQLKSFRQDL